MKQNTSEYIQYLVITGVITQLPENQQKLIKDCASKIKEIIAETSKIEEGCGELALALVGAETSAENV